MRKANLIPIAAAGLALAACEADAQQADDSTSVAGNAVAVETVTVAELSEMMENASIRLIDVRTDEEVEDGIIPGAEHIELDEFDPAKLDMSDGREIVLYCRSDRRSGIAAEQLSKFTGKPARHLDGGILAWEEAEKPVVIP